MIRRMFWALAAILIIVGCWHAYEARWDRGLFTGNCRNLSAAEAISYLREHPEAQVLDVRSASELTDGALPNAVNISIGDEAFGTKAAAFEKERPLLVYCAGGFRGRKAVARLKALGFQNIRHLHRGHMAWRLAVSGARDGAASSDH